MARTAKSVCFTCRLCFHGYHEVCPNCAGPMRVVGDFFRAPPRQKVKAWNRLEHRFRTTLQLPTGRTKRTGALRKSVRLYRERQEKWEKQQKRQCKTCDWCKTFCKRGAGHHVALCKERISNGRRTAIA